MSDDLRSIYKLEEWHVSAIPAVHGLVTNLALGVTPLLERQTSRRHLIFGPAIAKSALSCGEAALAKRLWRNHWIVNGAVDPELFFEET
jgi:hypothetical protein